MFRADFIRADNEVSFQHGDTEAQRHGLLRLTLRAVSLCLCVSVLNPSPLSATANGNRARPSGLTLAHLETDAAAQPLGIDDRAPRFSWALGSSRRGVLQTAYRVLVASRPELAREGGADVWDSGRVTSSDPWVVYAGPALKSRTRYYWTVHVWATGGLESDWARPAWFETALFDADEWKGQWIAGPERKGVLTEAEGQADDEVIRKAGEFCRPVSWLKGTWSAPLVRNNQGECRELRPAPLLRRS